MQSESIYEPQNSTKTAIKYRKYSKQLNTAKNERNKTKHYSKYFPFKITN